MRVERFKNQNYEKLKRSCLANNQLFVDSLFPAGPDVLFKSKRVDVEWKRPHQICDNPQLVVDGRDPRDVIQGQLGNCWFVAASSVLTSHKNNWDKVIPDIKEQEIDPQKKCAGIYKFRFWQFGTWIEVVIDDLLPTRNDKLLFTHSSNKNEFWSSLLEKAYAKLNGCYEHLDGGNLCEALQDFTGGVCETIRFNKAHGKNKSLNQHDLFFETMKKAYERKSLMTSAINTHSNNELEKKLPCGLIKGHAYGITKLNVMNIKGNSFFSFIASTSNEKLHMIRLRNPWGSNEWNGPWSDRSEHWNKVPKSEREKMGLNFDDDGEFWMEFNDFLYYFDEVSICRIINTSLLSIRKSWSESLAYSEWSTPKRAGGCVNFLGTFCDNPQFVFNIKNNDPEQTEEVLINLDQLSRRNVGKDNLTIGLFIMRVEDNRKYRLHSVKPKVVSSTFVNSRSVFLRHKFSNGRYVCIPSTYEPQFIGQFMLRIYSDENNELAELTKDYPVPCFFNCNPFSKYASCVTSLIVKSASNLKNLDSSGGFDSFIRIVCENKSVVGEVVKSSLNPEWNTSALFYRYKQKRPILIEIWIKKAFRNELYAGILLDAEPDNKHVILQSSLTTLKTKERKSGLVTIELQSMSNITAI